MGVRVAVVYATDFADISPGGIQAFIRGVGAHAPEDVDITYFGVGDASGHLPRERDHFVSVIDTRGWDRLPLNLWFCIGLRRRLETLAEFDVVVFHRVEHTAVGRLNAPAVLTLHGGTWNAFRAGRRVFGLAYPLLEAFAARRSEQVLSVAAKHHAWMTQRCAHEVVSIAVPVDLTNFPPRALVECGVKPTVVVVARLDREKRIERVLTAAAALSTCVHIFGEGPARPDLERMSRELGVACVMHGWSTPKDIAGFYSAHHCVFVLTSDFEGFPVAMAEAAATGVPVVGLRSPGLAEATEALGGVVAAHERELPQAITEAAQRGNSVAAQEIAATYGSSAVAAGFWDCVLRSARRNAGRATSL